MEEGVGTHWRHFFAKKDTKSTVVYGIDAGNSTVEAEHIILKNFLVADSGLIQT